MMARRFNRNNNDNNGSAEIKQIINEINQVNMLKDMSPKKICDVNGYADIVARNSNNNLKTTQLRKFFGAVRLIEQKETWNEIEVEFYLLKPQIAAATGRELIPRDFYNLMMALMKKVDVGSEDDKIKNFKKFVIFFESIVAYHKFYTGK